MLSFNKKTEKKIKMVGKTIHNCSQCEYKTTRRWNRDAHFKRKHANMESTFQQTKAKAKGFTIRDMQEDMFTEIDKLLEESRDVVKICKLLKRIKQSNNAVD